MITPYWSNTICAEEAQTHKRSTCFLYLSPTPCCRLLNLMVKHIGGGHLHTSSTSSSNVGSTPGSFIQLLHCFHDFFSTTLAPNMDFKHTNIYIVVSDAPQYKYKTFKRVLYMAFMWSCNQECVFVWQRRTKKFTLKKTGEAPARTTHQWLCQCVSS